MPNYGRSYGSYDQQLPFSSSSSSSFSNHRTAEELESQNDEAIEGLSAKVRLLKEVTHPFSRSLLLKILPEKCSFKLISWLNYFSGESELFF
jgi:hypothetical protein